MLRDYLKNKDKSSEKNTISPKKPQVFCSTSAILNFLINFVLHLCLVKLFNFLSKLVENLKLGLDNDLSIKFKIFKILCQKSNYPPAKLQEKKPILIVNKPDIVPLSSNSFSKRKYFSRYL